mgnify:CR=1 FL=1|tara:strand:- start:5257 stop:6021 length:765 start_codon:yes stop_codon:yes gene_type:complete
MGFSDFIGDIIGPVGGALALTNPVTAPFAPFIAGGGNAIGNLISGGSSRSQNSGQAANNEMLNMLLGYETPGSRFLEDYTQKVFFDAMDDYEDSDLAKSAFGNISDAVQAGNLDPFTANQFMESKLSPTSGYFGSDDYASLLNAEVKKGTQKNIVDDAFATNFYRAPSNKESRYLRNLADSMGMNKSPAQFNSFVNSRLANSLEGASKGPLSAAERATQAYYGRAVRLPDGTKTGTYNIWGFDRPAMNFSDSIA